MVPTALHLLLVEDNAGDAHLLRELLRHTKGLEITHVDRLADGLRVLGEGHVDIVLLDLGLPDSDGLDTLRTVVASFPEVPVIVSTGHDEEAIANAALEIGAEEYLPKGTLDSTVFLRSIRYSIGRHEQRRKIQQLNGILHSLRNINQNIVREKDPDRLIEKACEELTAMRGTEIAWIGLGDTESPPTAFVEAGWGKTFEPIARDLDQGKWPPCRRWAQESPDGIVLLDPETRCNTCPLQHKYSHGQDRALVVALRHDKEDLGVLNVSFPVGVSIDDEEKSLFVEMAGDIALALHHISLEKERRRYAQIVATSSEAMALVDRQYRYLVTNPSYCELVGHAGEDFTGRHVAEILGDTFFREKVEPEMMRCWSGEDAHYETVRGPLPQRIVDILYTPYRSADGAISAAAVCIRDITAQRLAEKVQRSESLRAQQYLDIVSVIIVAIDADGVVTMINPKGCDVLGYPEDEIVGKNWFSNFIAPAIRNEIRHVASSILAATNDSLAEYENPVVTRSGEERLIAWTNSPILDSEGKIVGHLGAGEDVTHRRKLDRDRRESQKETESLLRATRAILVESEFAKASSAVLEICSEHIGVDPGYTALLGLAKELPPALILKQGGSDCALDPGVTMPLRGLWEKAFKACKPVYENAFTSSEHHKRLPEGHLVLENMLVAPLVLGGQSTGLIALANKPGGLGKQDLRMAGAFAEILAIALREDRIRKDRVASETKYRTLFARSAD
ncbi:MAG: PAS domain-containing protein, partial [Deltaproteobacteria bacterium]|nr:PAS domain-containing protein [Deltaproteobacteria bacterium]